MLHHRVSLPLDGLPGAGLDSQSLDSEPFAATPNPYFGYSDGDRPENSRSAQHEIRRVRALQLVSAHGATAKMEKVYAHC